MMTASAIQAAERTFTIPQRIADGLAFIYERKPGCIRMARVRDGWVTTWEGGALLALPVVGAEYIIDHPERIPWPLYWIGYDADRKVWYVTRDNQP